MDTGCFDHCLTQDERERFDREGYLLIPQALPAASLGRVLEAVDRLDTEQRSAGLGPHVLLSMTDFVRRDGVFADLVDWPRVFPKVWGVLGWNIFLYHAHMDTTPPAEPARRVSQRDYRAWHQDSMRVNDEVECHPRPRLSVKVAYFLTDTSVPDCGAMYVQPGSQYNDELHLAPGQVDPPGAIPLKVKPGTAVLFDRRIWHSRSLNTSVVTRKGVFFGYSYRWMQPKDDMNVQGLLAAADPIRRQVLGWRTSADGLYSPTPEDVPLRAFLEKHHKLDTARSHHRGTAVGKPPR